MRRRRREKIVRSTRAQADEEKIEWEGVFDCRECRGSNASVLQYASLGAEWPNGRGGKQQTSFAQRRPNGMTGVGAGAGAGADADADADAAWADTNEAAGSACVLRGSWDGRGGEWAGRYDTVCGR